MDEKSKLTSSLKRIADEFIESNTTDEEEIHEVLSLSTVWNKESVMKQMLTDMEDFQLYEEDEFPYLSYVDKFIE